ncbi:hypothetical protein TRIUR3_04600 [Triticum urartu]|uniref:Uncharacterized protein n=2 Tax=Triticum TaxID=4564 RepID=A0A9R0TRY0_TRITD|nr:hypothetical protein TRIUR3_04600 [Triticum urartu]VAI18968.1 unnamed protein product [Triticum turgidum subsp. durum]
MNIITNSEGEVVNTYNPSQVLFFGNLEFIVDSYRELHLCSPAHCQTHELELIFINPPTSHFVANVESLHDVLGEHDVEEEESNESCPEAIPVRPWPWQTTASYMVDNHVGGRDNTNAEDFDDDDALGEDDPALLTTPVKGTDEPSKKFDSRELIYAEGLLSASCTRTEILRPQLHQDASCISITTSLTTDSSLVFLHQPRLIGLTSLTVG